LYDLIAKQIQKQQLAEVEADFSFVMIEPPVVPDRPFRPNVTRNCVMVLLLSFGISGFLLIFVPPLRERLNAFRELERERLAERKQPRR
jgi:hypothetical protein